MQESMRDAVQDSMQDGVPDGAGSYAERCRLRQVATPQCSAITATVLHRVQGFRMRSMPAQTEDTSR